MKKTFSSQAEELRAAIPEGKYQALAKEAGITSRWIRYFRDGAIPNPGIRTLDSLAKAIKAINKQK